MIEVTEGNLRDLSYIAVNMRQSDRVELFAAQPVQNIDMVVGGIDRACNLQRIFRRKDVPIAALFVAPERFGSYQVGFFATAQWPRIAKGATKWIKRTFIPQLVTTPNVNRVVCYSIASYHPMHRWLEFLGATLEGELPDYGVSRETFLQYAWRRSDFEDVCPELDPRLRGLGPAGPSAAAGAH